MLILFVVAVIATGIIAFKTKKYYDLMIFLGFFLYSFVLTINLFFGPSATIDAGNNIVKKEGLLSFNFILTLELLANFLTAIGFSVKAYLIIKKPNKSLQPTAESGG